MADEENERWQAYFARLKGLARKKLQHLPKRVKDEDDIAGSAIKSYLRGLERNGIRLSEQNDFDLWPLLATIAARKCADLFVYLKAKKRDVDRITDAELDAITCDEPGPASAAERRDIRRRMLDALKDDRSRQIAEWKIEGFTNKEIAKKLDCSDRTVQREIELIKIHWEKYVSHVWEESVEV